MMNKLVGKIYKIKNRDIQIVDTRSGNHQNGFAILMFSGVGSDSFDWFPLVRYLSGYEGCLVVDKPGYLKTSSSNNDLQEQIIEDAFNVLLELNVKKVFLIGHSLGFLSALLFYDKYRKAVKIMGICSLDGIDLDSSTSELFRKMSPPKWMQLLQRLIILDLGLYRKSMALDIKEYSKEYDLFIEYYNQDILKQRIGRKHIKAILKESNTLSKTIEKYLFLKEVKLSIPLLMIKAIDENGVEDSNEMKYFPHLKELILEVEENGEIWKTKLAKESNGQKIEIIASHFLHGEYPQLIAGHIIEFIKNKTCIG